MAAHNPEDSAGAQLAMLVALKYLLSAHVNTPGVEEGLRGNLESMRADLLASSSEERKLQAFEVTAEALLQALKPAPHS